MNKTIKEHLIVSLYIIIFDGIFLEIYLRSKGFGNKEVLIGFLGICFIGNLIYIFIKIVKKKF